MVFDAPAAAGAAFVSPPGDFSTLERLGDQTYRRTFTDQSRELFDSAGRLTRFVDRIGNIQRFEYDGQGRLTKIVDPVGLETTFAYTTGKVASITDPIGRQTRFEYDAAGDLTRITDPDGSSRTFEYDAQHRMTDKTDQRGNVDRVQYDAGGRAYAEVMPSFACTGCLTQLFVNSPVQTQGLTAFATAATRNPATAPFTSASSATTAQVSWDEGGYNRTVTLDEAGQRLTASDGIGLLPTDRRDARNLPTQSIDGRGYVTNYTYDSRGNVVSIRDELDAAGAALDFNGTSDYVQVAGSSALDSETLTIETWVKPRDNGDSILSGNPSAISTDDNYGPGLGVDTLRTGSASRPYSSLISVGTPGGGFRRISSASLPPDQWRHLALVYTPGNVKTYLDGQQIDDYSFTSGGPSSAAQFVLGRQGSAYFRGALDDVRIWSTARLPSQIQADMFRVLDGSEAGLVHYYPLDEGQGSVAVDHRSTGPGGSINGTINGATWSTAAAPLGPGLQYTYDATFSQLTRIVDQLGHQTLFDIDPTNGNTRSVTQVVGAIGGGDDVVTRYTYLVNGLVDTVTDPLGHVTDYDYDLLGRLTSVTFASGTPDQGQKQFEYDTAGNLTASVDENGRRTQYQYDVMNRLLRATQPDPDGVGPLPPPVTQFTYDSLGNILTSTDAANHTTTYEYNARNAVSRITDANGATTIYTYNNSGNVAVINDELGHTTQYLYDARQRRIETIDPDGGHTRFEYDVADNLTAVVDPAGNRTEYTYDARNRLTREKDPLGKFTFYAYDAANNRISTTDRNSRQITYSYDDLNRPVAETWVGGGNVLNLTFDAAGNLVRAVDNSSSTSLVRDARNRVTRVDNSGTPNVPAVVLTNTYDAVGNRLSLSDTIGGNNDEQVSYLYDALDRMTRVSQSGSGVSSLRTDFAYNAVGQFSSLRRYHDLAGTQLVVGTNYAYDSLSRLTAIAHQNSAGSSVAFETLSYDSASRITQIVDKDGTTNYTYDARDQLTGADHSASANPDETYSYDANGNRVSSSLHGTDYQTTASNRLLTDGKFNYAYDDEGNLVRRTEIATGKIREFQWDYRNRLTVISDQTGSNP
ncbi:MAG TPA: hypothetical protein PLV92_10345, partial [Pirellulaceae bacterium]|nr:hypothetical protein [Pirellulaceae bacterium]